MCQAPKPTETELRNITQLRAKAAAAAAATARVPHAGGQSTDSTNSTALAGGIAAVNDAWAGSGARDPAQQPGGDRHAMELSMKERRGAWVAPTSAGAGVPVRGVSPVRIVQTELVSRRSRKRSANIHGAYPSAGQPASGAEVAAAIA